MQHYFVKVTCKYDLHKCCGKADAVILLFVGACGMSFLSSAVRLSVYRNGGDDDDDSSKLGQAVILLIFIQAVARLKLCRDAVCTDICKWLSLVPEGF
jgi:hypothetical protein